MDPRNHFISANRLRHHLVEWGETGPVVLLLHGFLEHAHAWDFVAPSLADAGYHVLALDWRGHGDSDWVGPGGYYHFADYAADLAFLIRELGGTASLVGHSMGASAALLYAGTEPERIQALALVEGLGPPGSGFDEAPGRFAGWIADLEKLSTRRRRREPSLEAARQRLRERYPRVPEPALRVMADWGTREEGGERVWKFDPLHQTRSPQPYYVEQASGFWGRISCPVLYVEGARSPWRLPAEEVARRLGILRGRRVTIEGSGHHPHLEQPEELSRVLLDFLTRWGRLQPK